MNAEPQGIRRRHFNPIAVGRNNLLSRENHRLTARRGAGCDANESGHVDTVDDNSARAGDSGVADHLQRATEVGRRQSDAESIAAVHDSDTVIGCILLRPLDEHRTGKIVARDVYAVASTAFDTAVR